MHFYWPWGNLTAADVTPCVCFGLQMFLTVTTTTTPTPATTHWARTGLRCHTSPTTTTAPSRWMSTLASSAFIQSTIAACVFRTSKHIFFALMISDYYPSNRTPITSCSAVWKTWRGRDGACLGLRAMPLYLQTGNTTSPAKTQVRLGPMWDSHSGSDTLHFIHLEDTLMQRDLQQSSEMKWVD